MILINTDPSQGTDRVRGHDWHSPEGLAGWIAQWHPQTVSTAFQSVVPSMTVECSFTLKHRRTSLFTRPGFEAVPAFSGNGRYVDDPSATDIAHDGPLPAGIYYIVDRPQGGRLGPIRDAASDLVAGTHRASWFGLYRDDGSPDDWTQILAVRRGNFRLHPVGYGGISEGCITVLNIDAFKRLRSFLTVHQIRHIPGTCHRYCRRVTVR